VKADSKLLLAFGLMIGLCVYFWKGSIGKIGALYDVSSSLPGVLELIEKGKLSAYCALPSANPKKQNNSMTPGEMNPCRRIILRQSEVVHLLLVVDTRVCSSCEEYIARHVPRYPAFEEAQRLSRLTCPLSRLESKKDCDQVGMIKVQESLNGAIQRNTMSKSRISRSLAVTALLQVG
jgi:hypothetical protein